MPIIDKRFSKDRNILVNKKKYLDKIKDKVIEDFNKRAIIGSDAPDEFHIVSESDASDYFRDFSEYDIVSHSNDRYSKGDRIPVSGSGSGTEGGDSSEGSSEVVLSAQDYVDVLVNHFKLPRIRPVGYLEKDAVWRTAGIVKKGPMSRLHLLHTMKQSMARRIALGRPSPEDPDTEENERKRRAIPFLDESDLRFRGKIKEYRPSFSALMICIMDVSGSMNEEKRNLARYFLWIVWYMLKKSYKDVKVIFIRHTDKAEIVSQRTFFYENQSGGTLLSSGTEKAIEAIENHPPTNVYVLQVSDGENYSSDNNRFIEKVKAILKLVRFYGYVEINVGDRDIMYSSHTVYDILDFTEENFEKGKMSNREDAVSLIRKFFVTGGGK